MPIVICSVCLWGGFGERAKNFIINDMTIDEIEQELINMGFEQKEDTNIFYKRGKYSRVGVQVVEEMYGWDVQSASWEIVKRWLENAYQQYEKVVPRYPSPWNFDKKGAGNV